jgi:hypothetical protein
MTKRIELSCQPAACVPGNLVSTLMVVETLEHGSKVWPQNQRPATVQDLEALGYLAPEAVEKLRAAGAALLRWIYEGGLAYDNPEIEAALKAFADKQKE